MDDFEKKLYEILIKESLHTLFSSTKALKKWLSDQNKKYDLLGIFAKRYGKSLYENVNAIKVLGMESPIELSSILVNVNILQKIVSRHPNTVEALEMTLEKDQRGFSPIITSMDGVEYANMTDKFLVLGKPGAGKTTFLKTITLQTLDGKINKGNIPFLISLKDFSEEGVSFEDYLENQLEECGVPEAKVFVQRILEAGSALLLLDGLDEITSDAFETIKKTRKFSQKYGKCKYVISCRTASYNFWFEKFEDIEIADFDDEQILNFTRNWFRETPKSVEKFHQELNQNFHLKELAKTPLLLTLLCISFQQNLGFPPNRAELFEESIQLLLKKWDSQREIKREEPYKFL